jgi:UPF0755 protein
MSLKKYWWVFILGAPAFAGLLVSLVIYYKISLWTYNGPTTTFEIRPGEGFSKINARLSKSDFISSAKLFHRYSWVKGYMTKFKAGLYEIKSGSNMITLTDELVAGRTITNSVTVPEGKNLFEIATIFKNKKIIKSKNEFIRLAKSSAFAKKLGIPGERLEGYLYPDTYKLTPNSNEKTVLRAMVSSFRKQVESLSFDNSPLGLSQHDVITLASIVEKETGASFERPIIAGVFINRLKKRMRLQSDPTTIYGIYESYNGNLRKKHLLAKTPYNTYKIPALPAGPISNPGLESIKAVLNPKNHNYLYFVSQNDGTHIFTENYRLHREAVNRFQKNSAARRGKSWRDLKKGKKK